MRCSMITDVAVNRDVLEVFVQQVLVPKLAPGKMIVMDNLPNHKGKRVREISSRREAGANPAILASFAT